MSAVEDVASVIARAEQPPTTDDIVAALKASHGEDEVLEALEYLHREILAEEGVDDRWFWRGPPPPE